MLTECGHVPQVELPERTNGLIRDQVDGSQSQARRAGSGADTLAAPSLSGPAEHRRVDAPTRHRIAAHGDERDGWPSTRGEDGGRATRLPARPASPALNGRRPAPAAAWCAPGRAPPGGFAGGVGAAHPAQPDGEPRRPRPRLHPREPAAPLAADHPLVPGRGRGTSGNVPEEGPVLLVGNHSGGNMTPDTLLFTLAFSTYFGVERRLPPARPQPGAGLPGRPDPAPVRHRRRPRPRTLSGRSTPAPPCSSTRAATGRSTARSGSDNKVDFAGRKGFVRLALDADVPIVPVVSIGGQETALFLSRGGRLARALRVDRMLRLKVIPISLALPWGLNVGDLLGHIPLPAKITVEVLDPIDVRDAVRRRPRRRRGLRPRHHADAGDARHAGGRAALTRSSDRAR